MQRTNNNRLRRTRIQRSICRFIANTGGNAIVEVAVALPIVILLALGVADYARFHLAGITVANAARAGANYGANSPTWGPTEMIAAARADAGSVTLDSVTAAHYCSCRGTGTVDCATTTSCGSYGVPQAYDSVRVRKDVALIINYLGLPASVPVIRTVVLRSQ
jgi:Flp pilus assembly protein TadG